MNKSTHFSRQALYGQLLDLLDKNEILKLSWPYKGEHYVKSFDTYQHLTVMLYSFVCIGFYGGYCRLIATMLLPANQQGSPWHASQYWDIL